MSDKFACAFCKVTDDGQEYSYFDETGNKDSFFLATNPLWGIKDRTYVLMTQHESDTRWMILGAGNQQPFCGFHPIQVLRWTDFIESEQGSIWKFVLNDDKNPSTVSFTCKDSHLILHGVNDIIIHDERFGLLFFGFSIQANIRARLFGEVTNANRFSCKANGISMMSESLFLSRLESSSSVGERILKYESFSARLILPGRIDDYSKPKEFIDSIDSMKISSFRQKLFDCIKESHRFAKEFSIDPSSVRPYLIARAFYACWRNTKMLKQTLPVSTFLAAVKKYPFGISSLTKSELQQYETLQLADSSVSLPKDVKEYGDNNKWEMPVSPEVFPLLWIFGTDLRFSAPPEPAPEEPTPVAKPKSVPEQDPTPTPAPKPEIVPNPEAQPEPEPGNAAGNKPEEDPIAEQKAIIDFKAALDEAGWRYSLRDIVRFHTSVRCEPLTILGGAPGSGKSSLARLYASFFGLGEKKRFLPINVQPSWHDRMDFLGFVKTHGDQPVFVEAETGMAEFLENAAEYAKTNSSGLWLSCLEEINLARPEHYFADFLQWMSLKESLRDTTPIEFRNKIQQCETGPRKYSTIAKFTIPSCVRFVGTCNFDETTQNFSARFLDRCNYIELQPMSLSEMFFPKGRIASSEINFEKPSWEWRPYSFDSSPRLTEAKDSVLSILKALAPTGDNRKGILEKLGIMPSPRIVDGITRYVEARLDTTQDELAEENAAEGSNKTDDLFSRAFDEALLQRVLPKLFAAQSEFPSTNSYDLLQELKDVLSPGKNDIKLHLCNKFLEKRKNSNPSG